MYLATYNMTKNTCYCQFLAHGGDGIYCSSGHYWKRGCLKAMWTYDLRLEITATMGHLSVL